MTRHPAEGVLRRLLDEPVAVPVPAREHVAACPHCLDRLAVVQHDATLVGAALAPAPGPLPDAGAAWQRLVAAAPVAAPAVRSARRPRHLLRRPATAALAVGLVLAGAGTAAANDWLPVFRTQRVAPLGITAADLVALPDLSAYGDLASGGDPDVHAVADRAAAAAATGLDVPQVRDLPAGVEGAPVYQVGGQVSATFTFRAARAQAAAGTDLPAPPPGLDGSKVRLVAGPGVAEVWSEASGPPELVVGRAVAPTAFSTGVPFDVVRDYLLALPGLPPRLVEQLRTFTADGSTLPLPVPADQVTTSTADVDGVPATVLATRDRSLAAVVRVQDGVVTVVAGALGTDEVLAVARGLQ